MSIIDAVAAPFTAKAKLIGYAVTGGILLALGLLAWYFWNDYQSKIEELNKANVKISDQASQISSLNLTVGKLEKSNKIDDKIVTQTQQQVTEVKKTTENITQVHVQRVKEIEKKYDALPKTEPNLEAKAQEISQERVKSLWETFCIGVPEDKKCAEITKK